MINSTSVYNRLCEITTLDAEGAAICLPLCAEAAAEISQKLSSTSYETDSSAIFAAAATAYYRYMLLRCMEDGGVTDFKAGDVTVTKSTQCVMEAAQRIKQEALIAVSPLLCDDGFVFRQVGL